MMPILARLRWPGENWLRRASHCARVASASVSESAAVLQSLRPRIV